MNQDGKTAGITQPSGAAQEELMRSVYKRSGLDPLETGYVEAHGTGKQSHLAENSSCFVNMARQQLAFLGRGTAPLGTPVDVHQVLQSETLSRRRPLPRYSVRVDHQRILSTWDL